MRRLRGERPTVGTTGIGSMTADGRETRARAKRRSQASRIRCRLCGDAVTGEWAGHSTCERCVAMFLGDATPAPAKPRAKRVRLQPADRILLQVWPDGPASMPI
jgi:hypothetical protein